MDWQDTLKAKLPLFGHRNWIVVADSAYPLQTAPGIETVYSGAGHVEVLKTVLDAVNQAKHIRPLIYLDAELPHLSEEHAPGIGSLRTELGSALGGNEFQSLPHEEIIARLDEAGKLFNVLLLKTSLTLPYTSVFLQLDCGYWSEEAERALRGALKNG